ncbi:hypothetical protein OROGR_004738 [Orobanche gracilis]
MASIRNVAFPFREEMRYAEKINDFMGLCSIRKCNGWRRMRRTCAKMKTNSDTVNGKKVNGIHIDPIPFTNKRSSPPPAGLFILDGGNHDDDEYLLGRFVEDRFVYRQSFVIRSYEIGPDRTATMETLMNLLQETALNHVRRAGVAGNGFGATREMSIRKLIWVVTRIHVQVEKYGSWYLTGEI